MNKIDFEKTKPDFVNGDFKWYIHKDLQNYIEKEQADNLPALKGFGCFVVKSQDVEDYVLIDNKQNVVDGRPCTLQGYEQIQTKINMFKIAKHYEQHDI